MTLPRTVADVLGDHVTLEVECIDRMYLNLYQPRLQHELGVVGFFKLHRGFPFVSSALMDPISKQFVADIHRFVADHGVDLVDFRLGQRKDDVAHELPGRLRGRRGRAVRRPGPGEDRGVPHREAPQPGDRGDLPVAGAAHRDREPLLRVRASMPTSGRSSSSSAPTSPTTPRSASTATSGPNAKRPRPASVFEGLDNGFAACEDPSGLQRICDRLDDEQASTGFVRKWLARLPHPFTTADRRAGYRYDISILQAEFSLTQVLDRPLAGRVFFEEVIRDNLDLGRPDRVSLIFDRKIIRRGSEPRRVGSGPASSPTGSCRPCTSSTRPARVKQYHKQGVALRTETTINDTRDFGIGKRLHNLPALREVGFRANRRLLAVQRISHDPAIGEAAFTACRSTSPSSTAAVSRLSASTTSASRPCSPPWSCSVSCPTGSPTATCAPTWRPSSACNADSMTAGPMTYDLRRLRLHGLIERIPHTHRYRPTEFGFNTAVFFAHANRFLRHGMADTVDPTSPIASALRHVNAEADRIAQRAQLAA